MQAVATEEEKSQKATALLCAAPYPRKSYVIAKYICPDVFCMNDRISVISERNTLIVRIGPRDMSNIAAPADTISRR